MSWIVEVAYSDLDADRAMFDMYGPFNMASSAQHFADRIGTPVQDEPRRFTAVGVRELSQPKILTARARIQAFLGGQS